MSSLDIGLGAAVLGVNLTWLAVSRRHLQSRYMPDVSSWILVWGTALIGSAVLYTSVQFAGPVFLPAGVALFSLGWMSLLVDARAHVLPNVLTALMAAEVLASLLAATVTGSIPWASWMEPAAAAALWSVLPLAGWRTGQMGLGDVKLAPVLGAALGTTSLTLSVLGLAMAAMTAGVQAVLVRARGARGQRIAFGPHMISAAMILWALAATGPAVLGTAGV